MNTPLPPRRLLWPVMISVSVLNLAVDRLRRAVRPQPQLARMSQLAKVAHRPHVQR